jgi:hypothetical protein
MEKTHKQLRLKTRLKYVKRILENLLYRRVIRNIMFPSRLGRRTILGYADSGITFDRIYLNIPRGYTKFGTMIDFFLLNLPVARATRKRQKNLKKIINEEINRNLSFNKTTKILNLASGPARYLLELINTENKKHVEILCLDIDKHSLQFGKKLVRDRPARFGKANVFRLQHYKRAGEKLNWKPNVILASGLYFYYGDDIVINSFKEVCKHIDSEGLFIFDHLIGNPNRKLLAKVCITTRGKPWEFFYRKPMQIIAWLKDIGFTDIKYITDSWKMYIIYKARKLKTNNEK